MKQIRLVALIVCTLMCPSCGPGAESELRAVGANCLTSARLTQSEGGLDAKTLAELIEACNQQLSALTVTDTVKEPRLSKHEFR